MVSGFRYFMGFPPPSDPNPSRIVDMDGVAFEDLLATDHRFRLKAEDTDGPVAVWLSLAKETLGENVPIAVHASDKFKDGGEFNAVLWTSEEGGLLKAEAARWLDTKTLAAIKGARELHFEYPEAQAAEVSRKIEELGVVADQITTPAGCGIMFLSLNGIDIANLRAMQDNEIIEGLGSPE